MKHKGILIAASLLVIAVLLGIAIANVILAINRPQKLLVEKTQMTAEDEIVLEDEVDEISISFEEMVEFLEPKLEALDVETVHQFIYKAVIEQGLKKSTWGKEELKLALQPIVVQGIDEWVTSTILLVAKAKDIEVSKVMIQDLRDRFDHPDWYAFMTLYELAFLKNEGIIINGD